jgi:hypothetical protein
VISDGLPGRKLLDLAPEAAVAWFSSVRFHGVRERRAAHRGQAARAERGGAQKGAPAAIHPIPPLKPQALPGLSKHE